MEGLFLSFGVNWQITTNACNRAEILASEIPFSRKAYVSPGCGEAASEEGSDAESGLPASGIGEHGDALFAGVLAGGAGCNGCFECQKAGQDWKQPDSRPL